MSLQLSIMGILCILGSVLVAMFWHPSQQNDLSNSLVFCVIVGMLSLAALCWSAAYRIDLETETSTDKEETADAETADDRHD